MRCFPLFQRRRWSRLPWGVEEDWIRRQTSSVPFLHELKSNGFLLAHFGTLSFPREPEFVLRTFAEVLKQCPRCKLLLMGTAGSAEEDREMESFCRQLEISQNVIITGQIERSLLRDYLAYCDVSICAIPPKPIYEISSPHQTLREPRLRAYPSSRTGAFRNRKRWCGSPVAACWSTTKRRLLRRRFWVYCATEKTGAKWATAAEGMYGNATATNPSPGESHPVSIRQPIPAMECPGLMREIRYMPVSYDIRPARSRKASRGLCGTILCFLICTLLLAATGNAAELLATLGAARVLNFGGSLPDCIDKSILVERHGGALIADGVAGSALRLSSGEFLVLDARSLVQGTEGSLAFWFRPHWNQGDPASHTLLSFGWADGTRRVFCPLTGMVGASRLGIYVFHLEQSGFVARREGIAIQQR